MRNDNKYADSVTYHPYIWVCVLAYIPSHIHLYMSKSRLLLKTNDETNELCLQWVPYIPRTMAQDVPVLTGTCR